MMKCVQKRKRANAVGRLVALIRSRPDSCVGGQFLGGANLPQRPPPEPLQSSIKRSKQTTTGSKFVE